MISTVVNGARRVLVAVLLTATFVTICFLGPLGVYLALVAALASVVITFDGPSLRSAMSDWGVRGFVLAFFVIWASFLPSAKTSDDVMAFVDFLALPVILPAVALLSRFGAGKGITAVAALATIGALASVAIGLYEVRVLGQVRAKGNGESSSIFFSGMAALLAFFSLLGLQSSTSRLRWFFLFGNAAGVGAVLLGGTRGAMLAYGVLFSVFVAYTLTARNTALRMRLITVCLVLATTVVFIGTLFDLTRLQTIFVTASEAATQGTVSDQATNERLVIYSAAIQSFLQSPLYGHGWWNRFAAAVPFMGQLGVDVHARDNHAHLHNDILNFGSAGGIIAIFGYLVLMASPIVGAFRSPRTQNWGLRMTAAVGLVGAYLVMGAVDTMFVFEIPKSMFVLCSAVILGFFLDAPPTTPREAVEGASN
ncbi:MAG: O-antigen ligase family protein [Alphaproteobacteria bacterium]|nr:O-antigen ligase family protein [Alphaproteobacteria bacterium]